VACARVEVKVVVGQAVGTGEASGWTMAERGEPRAEALPLSPETVRIAPLELSMADRLVREVRAPPVGCRGPDHRTVRVRATGVAVGAGVGDAVGWGTTPPPHPPLHPARSATTTAVIIGYLIGTPAFLEHGASAPSTRVVYRIHPILVKFGQNWQDFCPGSRIPSRTPSNKQQTKKNIKEKDRCPPMDSMSIENFSKEIAGTIERYLPHTPLHLLVKVLATHQIDLMSLHAEAITKHLIQNMQALIAAREPVDEPEASLQP
jgi:hypothetical protein